MECSIRDRIKNGINKTIDNALLGSGLFTKSDNKFTVSNVNSNYSSVIDSMNESFKEQVLVKNNDFYYTSISDELIDKYEKAKLGIIKVPFKALNEKDINDILDELGINEDTTLQEYIQKSLSPTDLVNLSRANPLLKLEWTREKQSSYDSANNTVNISLDEVKFVSIATGLPLKQVADILIGHEVAHATTYFALRKGDNDVKLSQIREKLIELHKKNPYVDKFRMNYIGEDELPYSLKDVDEMVADSTHNPFFAEWLKSNRDEDGQSFFQKIINAILEWFGISRPSYYDTILEILTNERFQDSNHEGVIDSIDGTPMILVELYGMPKTFIQEAYEFFTSTSIQDDVREVIKSIPTVITKLKLDLERETDKNIKNSIKSLIDSFNYSKDDEGKIVSSLNMLIQAAEYSKDLIIKLDELNNIKDDNKKLMLAMGLNQAAQSLEFIEPLVAELMKELQVLGDTKLLRDFRNQISGILGTRATINTQYVKLIKAPILNILSESYSQDEIIAKLKLEVAKFEDLKNKTVSLKEKNLYAARIERLLKEIEQTPSRNYFEKVFAGQGLDASSYEIYLNAPIQNSNAIISTVMDILQKNNQAVSQEMVNVANIFQTKLDKLKKALGVSEIKNTDSFYEPILDEVEFVMEVKEDANGVIQASKTITQKMLLSEYDSTYLKEYFYKNTLVDYYYKQMVEANKAKDDTLAEKYYNLLETAKKDKYSFEEKNSERRYVDKVYDMYKLFDKELNNNGTTTTFGKERGKLFEQIQMYEKLRDSSIDLGDNEKVQEAINELRGQIQQLSSLYDKDGQLKTGFDKDLAEVAIKYKELRKEYGKYVLTDAGRQLFETQKLKLDKMLSEQRLTQEQYNARLSDISVVETTDEFKELIRSSRETMNNLAEQLYKIPELKSIFENEGKTLISEGYDKLTAVTNGFRDDDYVIDGSTFSKNRENLVPEVKKIQESLQSLYEGAQKLKSLSINDSNRMRELNKKDSLTSDETAELQELKDKLKQIKEKYNKNKSLIDAYNKAVNNYRELYSNKETAYYELEAKKQYENYSAIKRQELSKKIGSLTSVGAFRKVDGEWFLLTMKGGKEVYQTLDNKAFASNEDAAIFNIVHEQMKVEWFETDWYKNNHYEKTIFDYKNQQFITVTEPIYIWTQSIPSKEEWLVPNQPSIKFKSYKINDENINPNFKVLNDGIPMPKPNVFRNKKYEDLKNNSPEYFEFLSFVRDDYRKKQLSYPPEKRMFDVLPSLVRTNDEIQSDLVSSIADKAKKLMAFNISFQNVESEDEKIVTGGSTTNMYAKNKIIPIRFAGKMDKSKQSSDVTAMMLTFNIASIEYAEMLKDQPLIEGLRSVLENTDMLEVKNVLSKFSWVNAWNVLRNKPEQKTSKKDVKVSNTTKALDFIADTYMYGETKTAAHGVIAGFDVDFNKAASNLKRVSSFSIFALNAFSGVKNTLTSTITGYINSNIGKGYYSAMEYSKSHGEAILYVKDLLSDYTKFGNKSKLGQELDFFQVIEGSFYNMYGKKTAFSYIKNIEAGLTSFKNASEIEIQVAQYLAMSKANPVEVDGKMVEFREAFEVKDGIFKKKDGAKLEQKDIDNFINRVLYLNRNINGAYRQMERNAMQKNVLGDLAFYLNGYLISGILARFGGSQWVTDGQMNVRGFHMETARLLGDLVKYRAGLSTTWHTLTEEEKARVNRSLRELFVVVAATILAMMLGADDGKEELRDNISIHNWMIAVTLGVKSELETFIPLPGFGLNELARKMNSPFAALRQVTGIIKLVENFSLFVMQSDKAYYKATGIRDGFHDKGDAKYIANFLKLVGYSGAGMNALDKIQQIKQSQQLR